MPGFADFQSAVWKALNGDPALQTLLGGANKVYDDVPHGKEAAAPAYPYVTLGDQVGAEAGASDTQMADMQITLHAWSRGAGRLQSLQIIDAMRDAGNLPVNIAAVISNRPDAAGLSSPW